MIMFPNGMAEVGIAFTTKAVSASCSLLTFFSQVCGHQLDFIGEALETQLFESLLIISGIAQICLSFRFLLKEQLMFEKW